MLVTRKLQHRPLRLIGGHVVLDAACVVPVLVHKDASAGAMMHVCSCIGMELGMRVWVQ